MPRTEDAAAESDSSNATLCDNCSMALLKALVCARASQDRKEERREGDRKRGRGQGEGGGTEGDWGCIDEQRMNIGTKSFQVTNLSRGRGREGGRERCKGRGRGDGGGRGASE
jgi:hypothetical protein